MGGVQAARSPPLAAAAQVPRYVYDRSFWLFGAVLLIDCLNALFESRNTKLDFVLLPAFIKAMATGTNYLMRSGRGALALSSSGRL